GYRYIMRQRIYNKIHKRVLLPVRIKPHEVKAILKGGVLEIYLPKAEGGEEVEVAVD
ncbi:MAG: Hsp20/alpha crystallin family protein, partial [Thermoprotei archaeon]